MPSKGADPPELGPTLQEVEFLGCQLDLRDSGTIDRCVFTGISNYEAVFTKDGNPLFTQCLWFGNPASTHAVTRQTGSTGALTLVNCTILSGLAAPVRVRDNSRVDMTNTILDAAPSVSTTGGVLNAARCLYPGATGNNLDGLPTFVDAPGGDFGLTSASLGLDAADFTIYSAVSSATTDVDFNPRTADSLCVANTGTGVPDYMDLGALEFQPDNTDTDSDGVPDVCDVCPGFDDTLDGDSDGVPNGCDVCQGDDATYDSDGDGVCDDIDACPGFDDSVDSDGDGVANGCDVCPGFDDALDGDSDGVPDGCDICPGFDDSIDMDGDGTPDGCDSNPVFNVTQGTGHTTIQLALDNANNGDQIQVSALTFPEDDITFANGLDVTITGAGVGQTIVDGGQ